MKTAVIKSADGAVINIGPWDYRAVPILADDHDRPIRDEAGRVTGYEQKQVGEAITNPLPAGAYLDEHDVVDGPDGGKYAAGNYRALRRAEYPSVGDQLDALYKAGLFPADMAAQLAGIKAKYPKTNG